MSTVNRAMKRAAAKKAFRHDSKMSDVNKELATIASEKTIKQMSANITKLMIRACCLAEMQNFKSLMKKETRIQNTIALVHEYVNKISKEQLTKEEQNLVYEINKEFDSFVERVYKDEMQK